MLSRLWANSLCLEAESQCIDNFNIKQPFCDLLEIE